MMTRTQLRTALGRLDACHDARGWVDSSDPTATPEQLWGHCCRGDWLLWLAARAGVDRRMLVRAACECAKLAWPHIDADRHGDTLLAAMLAVHVAEEWCEGRVDEGDLHAAAAAAAAYAAYTADVAYAAAAAAAAYAYAHGRARGETVWGGLRLFPWSGVEPLLLAAATEGR
mgnify:FL=1